MRRRLSPRGLLAIGLLALHSPPCDGGDPTAPTLTGNPPPTLGNGLELDG